MEDKAEAGEGAASQEQGGTPERVSTARITGGCGRTPEDICLIPLFQPQLRCQD